MAETRIIHARKLFDGRATDPLPDRAIVLAGDRIEAVCPMSEASAAPVMAEAAIVAPGFVDLQINGAGGALFNDSPDLDGLRTMADGARKGGTAWLLPTYITDHDARYRRAIAAVAAAIGQVPGVIGVHLEGPFLSPLRPGIHPAGAIRPIAEEDIVALTGAGVPLLLTLAPEQTSPAVIHRLAEAGVCVFAGHSEAGHETLVAAEAAGLRGLTHLFNAMSQMQGREPGMVGSAFASDALFAGVIADGIHVHPANLRSALHALGPDRLFLVTDAMSPLGTGIEGFDLAGTWITRRDGRLTGETGTLAGADISMIEAITRMVAFTGCPLGDAIRMATLTPARAIGLDGEIGSVEPGKRAGLTLLSEALAVQSVCVDGMLYG